MLIQAKFGSSSALGTSSIVAAMQPLFKLAVILFYFAAIV